MCDMEVHEHVMVEGATAKLTERLVHRNVSNLSRYIQKHDEYSNWEARVWLSDRVPEARELLASGRVAAVSAVPTGLNKPGWSVPRHECLG